MRPWLRESSGSGVRSPPVSTRSLVQRPSPGDPLRPQLDMVLGYARPFLKAVEHYASRVPPDTPVSEFVFLLQIAQGQRSHYLRLLPRAVTTEDVLVLQLHFEHYDYAFWQGFRAIDAALPGATDADGVLTPAVRAMRQAMFEGVIRQRGLYLDVTTPGVQEEAIVIMSGFVLARISLRIPRLWDALVHLGNPYKVLVEHLLANVFTAYHDGAWSSFDALRNAVVTHIIADCATDTPADHLPAEGELKMALEVEQWGSLSSTEAAVRHQFELEDLVSALGHEAGLTSLEERIVQMALDHSYSDIASVLEKSNAAVRQRYAAARKKLAALPPEELKRRLKSS